MMKTTSFSLTPERAEVIRARYADLTRKNKDSLKAIFSRLHRVCSLNAAAKADLVSGIMEAEFGARAYSAAFNS